VYAFNGMVFVKASSLTSFGSTFGGILAAFDASTGALIWQKQGAFGSIQKLDNTYMLAGANCYKIADGSLVWTGPAGFTVDQGSTSGAGWIPELKMMMTATRAWNLPYPSQPPTLAWDRLADVNVQAGRSVYGDGKVFIGTGDMDLKAYDAKTGKLLWTTPTSGVFTYGASYGDGKVFYGGLDNNMRAYDANTGKVLWTYNPGTWYGQWASSSGYAYGMVYEHNQDNFIYAINGTTGQLVWKQEGPGIWYSNMLKIADGKVYCQMGEREYRNFNTGVFATPEYDCFDAYTGKLIWSMPMEDGAPFNFECIAYGNLYVVPTVSEAVEGVFFGSRYLGELWCIGSQPADWPMFLKDPAHTADGNGPTNLALKWKFDAGAVVISAATCVDGVVYFGSSNNYIYALNAETGSKIWGFATGFKQWSSPAVVNGRLYTGADDGNIYCLNAATGAKIWETYAGGKTRSLNSGGIGWTHVRSSPMVLDGRVYAAALDGNLYCLDTSSGNVVWTFNTGDQSEIYATPAIVDNAIYLASSIPNPPGTNGTFYKLDLNGKVIWQKVIPYVLDKTPGNGDYLFASPTPVPELGLVFLRNGLRLNYAIDMETGNTVWTYDNKYNPGTPNQLGGTPNVDAPLYAYGRLYMNDFYGVTCLNATTGSEIWYQYFSREINNMGITYTYGRVYVANELGVIYVLDAVTGAKLSYHEFGTVQLHCSPVPYNGNLYIGSSDFYMYCFGDARLMAASAPKPQALATDAPISSLAVAPIVAEPSVNETVWSSSTVYIAIAAAVIAVAASAAAVVVLRKRR